jgi:phosphoglycerate dehydrogenase-like enzyme
VPAEPTVLLTYEPSHEHAAALRKAAPGARLVAAGDERTARRLMEGAEVVLGNRFFLQSLDAARRLRWMQSGSVGVDRLLREGGSRLDGVRLTCARGVYDDEVAEHALALVLALARGLHAARDDQRAERWLPRPLGSLAGRRTLVLGWGGVGRGIARRLAAFGAEVWAARRSQEGAPVRDGDALVFGPAGWRPLLPLVQVLVLALPATPETARLVGEEEIAQLPPDAVLVNVGRPDTLDQDGLLAALRRGRLAGAGLDVLEEEPPPPGSAVWTEPRLLLTPHVARSREAPPRRWEPLFAENLRRYAAGEPLLNEVDKSRGY